MWKLQSKVQTFVKLEKRKWSLMKWLTQFGHLKKKPQRISTNMFNPKKYKKNICNIIFRLLYQSFSKKLNQYKKENGHLFSLFNFTMNMLKYIIIHSSHPIIKTELAFNSDSTNYFSILIQCWPLAQDCM